MIPNSACRNPCGLAQREMGDKPQGQRGLDGEIRVPPRPTPPAAPPGRPGSDRVRGHPHRHSAAANEGLVIGRPVRHAVLRLIRGMNLRLHPGSVTPAEGHEKCRPRRRPTRRRSFMHQRPVGGPRHRSGREHSRGGLSSPDTTAGAPDAAVHVGRSAPTIRVGAPALAPHPRGR